MKRNILIILVCLALLLSSASLAQAACYGHWASCDSGTPNTCEGCGETNIYCEIIHDFGGYSYDAQNHWSICKKCGEQCDVEAHFALCFNPTVCDLCGATGLANVELGHPNFVVKSDAQECWGECSDCGTESFRESHYTFCTDQGKCSYCGYPGTGFAPYHEFESFSDGTHHWKECSECGEKANEGPHSAPCSAPGKCEECGATGTVVLSHTEVVDEAVAPTCTETGLTEGKHCSACSTVLVKQEIVKELGHTEVIDAAVAPTCTETGLTEGKHCSGCNTVLVKQEIVKELGHTEGIDEAVAPTCTEDGLTEGKHCSVCGEVLIPQGTVTRLYHNWQFTSSVPATCTEDGATRYTCSICGYYYMDRPAALGHDYDEYLSQQDGTHMAICRLCDQGAVENCQMEAGTCALCGYVLPADSDSAAVPCVECENGPIEGISLEVVNQAQSSSAPALPQAAQNAVHVFRVSLKQDGLEIAPQGNVLIRLPIENESTLEGLKLMLVQEDGTLLEIAYEIQDGMIVFKTNQTGTFVFLP